jgi:hypothetical protein
LPQAKNDEIEQFTVQLIADLNRQDAKKAQAMHQLGQILGALAVQLSGANLAQACSRFHFQV